MLSALFAEISEGKFCWVAEGGLGWMAWEGKRYQPVDIADVVEAAKQWVNERYSEMCVYIGSCPHQSPEQQSAEKCAKAWKSYRFRSKVTSFVLFMCGDKKIRRYPEQFDANQDLLNTTAGVLDLNTYELYEHDPAFMMTKITRCAYVKGAKHKDWDLVL